MKIIRHMFISVLLLACMSASFAMKKAVSGGAKKSVTFAPGTVFKDDDACDEIKKGDGLKKRAEKDKKKNEERVNFLKLNDFLRSLSIEEEDRTKEIRMRTTDIKIKYKNQSVLPDLTTTLMDLCDKWNEETCNGILEGSRWLPVISDKSFLPSSESITKHLAEKTGLDTNKLDCIMLSVDGLTEEHINSYKKLIRDIVPESRLKPLPTFEIMGRIRGFWKEIGHKNKTIVTGIKKAVNSAM